MFFSSTFYRQKICKLFVLLMLLSVFTFPLFSKQKSSATPNHSENENATSSEFVGSSSEISDSPSEIPGQPSELPDQPSELPDRPSDSTLDYVCSILASHPVTQGDFVQQKKRPNQNRVLTSSGTFVFSKQGVYFKTEKPIASEMGVTETKLITVSNGKKTVIDNSSNETFRGIALIIVSLLNGDKTEIEKNFLVETAPNTSGGVSSDATSSNAAGSWTVSLTPKDATIASSIKSLKISGTNKLETLIMENAGGGTVSFTLSNQTYKENLTDEYQKIFAEK